MHRMESKPSIRRAERQDLPQVIALFASDALGGHGDTSDPDAFADYLAAFERITAAPHEALYVAELDDEVVGTFQTTLLTSLVGRGASNMMIEAVQTRHDMRGKGIGEAMIRFAIEEARRLDLYKVQLTSNRDRKDAHRFYERIGFQPTHLGFKIRLK